MVFVIKGKYKNFETEEIDTAETKKEAEYLLKEYKMAYGTDYSLYISH